MNTEITKNDSEKGKLINCDITVRDGDGPLFIGRQDGTIVANLDGYMIIPKEQYDTQTVRD